MTTTTTRLSRREKRLIREAERRLVLALSAELHRVSKKNESCVGGAEWFAHYNRGFVNGLGNAANYIEGLVFNGRIPSAAQ